MCEEIKLLKSNAIEAYRKADKSSKETLVNLFKGQVDFNQKITDLINGYLDACTDQNLAPLTIEHFSYIPIQYRERMFKHYQQNVIADSLNEGWVPNWKDHNQPKYYPYFKDSGAGFGFSNTYCDDWYSGSIVGSRLYFKDEATAIHFGKLCVKSGII